MRPDSVIPKNLRMDDAVSGQAAIPEKNANQPFVGGHGPNRMRSINPPAPAKAVQPHAAASKSTFESAARGFHRKKPHVLRLFCCYLGSAGKKYRRCNS